MDGSMASQQNLAKLQLAIVALRAPTNRLADTSPHAMPTRCHRRVADERLRPA